MSLGSFPAPETSLSGVSDESLLEELLRRPRMLFEIIRVVLPSVSARVLCKHDWFVKIFNSLLPMLHTCAVPSPLVVSSPRIMCRIHTSVTTFGGYEPPGGIISATLGYLLHDCWSAEELADFGGISDFMGTSVTWDPDECVFIVRDVGAPITQYARYDVTFLDVHPPPVIYTFVEE